LGVVLLLVLLVGREKSRFRFYCRMEGLAAARWDLVSGLFCGRRKFWICVIEKGLIGFAHVRPCDRVLYSGVVLRSWGKKCRAVGGRMLNGKWRQKNN